MTRSRGVGRGPAPVRMAAICRAGVAEGRQIRREERFLVAQSALSGLEFARKRTLQERAHPTTRAPTARSARSLAAPTIRWEANGDWCPSRSSKPVRRRETVGGFDSRPPPLEIRALTWDFVSGHGLGRSGTESRKPERSRCPHKSFRLPRWARIPTAQVFLALPPHKSSAPSWNQRKERHGTTTNYPHRTGDDCRSPGPVPGPL
jgi:hypothetical protein